jgi:pyruvate/2-oxoglutarate dehydrogenase complex dihydrolipoamide acyltransferase (E2) component
VRAIAQAFDQAERQVQRLKTLQAQGMTSMQALEDAEVRRNNAQSDLVAPRRAWCRRAPMLQRTEVRAPFDGVVSERKVLRGDTAQVGKELVKVIDPRSMRFEGLVSADRMHELQIGQRSLSASTATQADFAGTVQRIDAAANAMTRQVEVLVAFARGRAAARAGLCMPRAASRPARAGADAARERGGARGRRHARLARQDLTLQKVRCSSASATRARRVLRCCAAWPPAIAILRSPGSTLVDGQKSSSRRPRRGRLGRRRPPQPRDAPCSSPTSASSARSRWS